MPGSSLHFGAAVEVDAFGALETVGALRIVSDGYSSGRGIHDLDWLPSLDRVDDELEITENRFLTDVSALTGLSLGGTFEVRDNEDLDDCAVLAIWQSMDIELASVASQLPTSLASAGACD